MTPRVSTPPELSSSVEAALRQARREKKRGHHRKVMLLLKKAVCERVDSPTLWNRYGLSCVRQGRMEDAERAFAQSAYLDKKRGNHRRAAVTKQIAERARSGVFFD